MITDRRKFIIRDFYSLHFYSTVEINSKSFPWNVHYVQENFPNFLRRPKRVDNTSDNADITQSQAADLHRLLSHVTRGLVECRK